MWKMKKIGEHKRAVAGAKGEELCRWQRVWAFWASVDLYQVDLQYQEMK
jgi:hypothetical protein